MEQTVVREAEEARARAMRGLEHGSSAILVAQDFGAAGELFSEAGKLLATRVREEERKAKRAAP